MAQTNVSPPPNDDENELNESSNPKGSPSLNSMGGNNQGLGQSSLRKSQKSKSNSFDPALLQVIHQKNKNPPSKFSMHKKKK